LHKHQTYTSENYNVLKQKPQEKKAEGVFGWEIRNDEAELELMNLNSFREETME